MTGLARSTYYYRPKVDPKLKAQQDADLRDRIERIQAEFPGYGYRRVYRELLKRSRKCLTPMPEQVEVARQGGRVAGVL